MIIDQLLAMILFKFQIRRNEKIYPNLGHVKFIQTRNIQSQTTNFVETFLLIHLNVICFFVHGIKSIQSNFD